MIRSSCPASRMRPRAGSRCRRRCQELPRGSRGSAMVRRASYREPVKTARPALSTAPTRYRGLACPHRSPGRSPRLPRGVGYCRIPGVGWTAIVFLCFDQKNHSKDWVVNLVVNGRLRAEGYHERLSPPRNSIPVQDQKLVKAT